MPPAAPLFNVVQGCHWDTDTHSPRAPRLCQVPGPFKLPYASAELLTVTVPVALHMDYDAAFKNQSIGVPERLAEHLERWSVHAAGAEPAALFVNDYPNAPSLPNAGVLP